MHYALAVPLLFWAAIVAADEPAWTRDTGLKPFTYGVTRKDTPLVAWMHPEAWSPSGKKRRVLLIGGTADAGGVTAVERAVAWFYASESTAELRKSIVLSAIPDVYPDDVSDGPDRPQFALPKDGFYDAKTLPENRYLWRFLALPAPDVVFELTGDDDAGDVYGGQLAKALGAAAPGDIGVIPAERLHCHYDSPATTHKSLLHSLGELSADPSAARLELQRRGLRATNEVAAELGTRYGFELKEVAYIPALALVAKERLADRTAGNVHLKFVSERTPVPKSGGEQAGHLYFRELTLRSIDDESRARWIKLVQIAADTKVSHNEMSDAVFMSGPILAAAGRLTKEPKYFDECFAHLQLMRKLCLREDGLYRHSPLCEAAWGRGNGFPALGLDFVLEDWPQDDSRRKEISTWQRTHLTALLKQQEIDGTWRQVIDDPRSYREFTATAMIAYALFRGIDRGDLPREEFKPAAYRAWDAIKLRVGSKGELFDVCTGTGKQKSLRDYFDRPAILGVDARGGAMALMLASAVLAHEARK